MNISSGLGTMWMTYPNNNIVKEGCIPRKMSQVPLLRGKGKANQPLIIFSSCDKWLIRVVMVLYT